MQIHGYVLQILYPIFYVLLYTSPTIIKIKKINIKSDKFLSHFLCSSWYYISLIALCIYSG